MQQSTVKRVIVSGLKTVPERNQIEVNALLTTSPPGVTLRDAERIADVCYPGFADCVSLSGERDVNFRIAHKDGRALTLKFINTAERLEETEMQVSVLKHLQRQGGVNVPCHQPVNEAVLAKVQGIEPGVCANGVTLDWVLYQPTEDTDPLRVRAYSYLEGVVGSKLAAQPQAWRALGSVVAKLGIQLAKFDHPAAHRQLLWDTCQVLGIRPMLSALEDQAELRMIEEFLDIFEQKVMPVLAHLPHQIIHNDLSPSNLLVDPEGATPVGILDFGDMVYAPRIAEIAVAASYQMANSPEPIRVLDALVEGYQSEEKLSAEERSHIIDLVLARLAQRMVITSWRAVRFPANRGYIMRSHDAAKALFVPLYEGWRHCKYVLDAGPNNSARVTDHT